MAWSFWDWGSAAFNAVVTTFVFSTFLVSDGVFTSTEDANKALSLGLSVAGLIIALLAPITGQRSDRQGRGTLMLGVFTFAVVGCMFLMFFVAPDSPLGLSKIQSLWLGIGLLGLGNIFFEFASVNYNAMLGRISTPKTMGRVSGLGWGMGYVGGIVLLGILLIAFIMPDVGLFGVTGENGLHVRVSVVFSALWFGLSALPVLLMIRGRKVQDRESSVEGAAPEASKNAPQGRESIITSYKLLIRTIIGLAKRSPHTLFFLISSAVFRDGLAGVFTFGAIIAASVFGFSTTEVMLFGIAANVVAGIATIAFGYLDDVIGPKRVIILSLVSMLVCGMTIFFLHEGGKTMFWIFGLLLCIWVGPAQSASRSFLARVIPEGREGEVFGLYATTGRAVSFLSPMLYGVAIGVGALVMGPGADATYWGILGIMVVLFAGLMLLLPVKQITSTH
ncbi:MAG: MFS transporter [Actinomycetaceae bacterium]|nr:MFS transporter [Actinomycetaceae bacterium]